MQSAALAELGLAGEWSYEAIEVAPEDFAALVRAMPGEGFVGANVTIPHKVAALALADDASEVARGIGAANTLSFADGRAFAAEMPEDAVGAMITSHSQTPREVRRDAFRLCAEVIGGYPGPLTAGLPKPAKTTLEWRGAWERRCFDVAILLFELVGLSPVP